MEKFMKSNAAVKEDPGSVKGSFIKTHRGTSIQYASFIFVIVLFYVLTSGEIFSVYNIKTLVGQTTPLIIASVGVIFVFAKEFIYFGSQFNSKAIWVFSWDLNVVFLFSLRDSEKHDKFGLVEFIGKINDSK